MTTDLHHGSRAGDLPAWVANLGAVERHGTTASWEGWSAAIRTFCVTFNAGPLETACEVHSLPRSFYTLDERCLIKPRT